jgi:transposase InsO family protein
MAAVARAELLKPDKPSQRWSMDFMLDALSDGRRLKVLTIVDNYSRKCHRAEVDTSINGVRVVRTLNEIALEKDCQNPLPSMTGRNSSVKPWVPGHIRGE